MYYRYSAAGGSLVQITRAASFRSRGKFVAVALDHRFVGGDHAFSGVKKRKRILICGVEPAHRLCHDGNAVVTEYIFKAVCYHVGKRMPGERTQIENMTYIKTVGAGSLRYKVTVHTYDLADSLSDSSEAHNCDIRHKHASFLLAVYHISRRNAIVRGLSIRLRVLLFLRVWCIMLSGIICVRKKHYYA